ncbi:MAG: endonuclease/exonuclease/phosphatase family protein [Deltaproteobacteria bacterium]|nr:endonuclease/exonuclease/phosphatase family protein [Deltaproteobacteria bacterium]
MALRRLAGWRGWALSAALLALGMAATAPADERLVQGKLLAVKDPKPGDPSKRSLKLRAVEKQSSDVVSGDPTLPLGAGGAVVEVAVNGAVDSAQIYQLPQGTRADGDPFWSASSGGFRYADPDGEQGPVAAVRLERSSGGALKMSVDLRGRHAALDIVPPNLGTDGFVALRLSGGDRYCAGFGPDAKQKNKGAQLWLARQAPAETCGTPAVTSGDFLALSYNVAGLPEGISGSHPAVNTAQISPKLNAYDLVVVQESWQTPDPNPLAPLRVYHEILAADATHPYKSVPVPLPLGANPARPSALVSDGVNVFSRFPFTNVVHQPWAECWDTAADCLAMKGFMLARTTVAPGVTIDVYDLHNEAGSDPEDDTVRTNDMAQLAAFINAHSAGNAVIVGGDFNLHTNEEPDSTIFQQLLAATGLTDVCAHLSCPSPGRIDKWLFRSSDAISITPLSWQFETEVFKDSMGEQLSDHEALAVRFGWALNP